MWSSQTLVTPPGRENHHHYQCPVVPAEHRTCSTAATGEAGEYLGCCACITKQGPFAITTHPPILHHHCQGEEKTGGSWQQGQCLSAGSPLSPFARRQVVTCSMWSLSWLPRSQGWQGLAPPNYLPLTLPNAPQPLHLHLQVSYQAE